MATDDLALESPPRRVPASLALRLLLGGPLSGIGWLVLGFGGIFFWVFVAGSSIFDLVHFAGELQTVEGEVIDSWETRCEENEVEVYAQQFVFTAPDGRRAEGVSYASGQALPAGAKVKVELSPSDPTRARIAGMRTRPFGPLAAIVVIFPLVGLILAFIGTAKGAKAMTLLRVGRLGWGELVDKQRTNVRVNDEPVYELTFEFEADDGRKHSTRVRTHDTEDLEDEPRERLLYHPDEPSWAVLFDALPRQPEVDAQGRLQPVPAWQVALVLLLPGGTLLGHGLYFVLAHGG